MGITILGMARCYINPAQTKLWPHTRRYLVLLRFVARGAIVRGTPQTLNRQSPSRDRLEKRDPVLEPEVRLPPVYRPHSQNERRNFRQTAAQIPASESLCASED